MRKEIFSKAALERLSSPEQIDALMRVTRPGGWMALLTTGIVLVGVGIWSVVGSIQLTVEGKGILIRGGSLIDIEAGSGGRISEFLVKPGDIIHEGDVVASVAQGGLIEEINKLKLSIGDQMKEDIRRTADENAMEKSRKDTLAAEAQRIVTQLPALRTQLEDMQRQAKDKEAAFEKGLITRAQVLAAQQSLLTLTQQIQSQEQRTQQIEVEQQTVSSQNATAQATRRTALADLQRELESKERGAQSASKIRSHASGRVLERVVDAGELVQPSTRILSLEPLDSPLVCILYVPSGEGKKIEPGYQVRMSPSTVRKEEYGVMIGTVRSVSSYPATAQGMERTLRNPTLAHELAGKGAPLEVVVELTTDASTESKFKWSSPKGPPVGIFGGTMCEGAVVVDERKPISYIIPLVKAKIGLH